MNSFFITSKPYHVTLDVTQKSEISDDIIMNLINAASGTKVNVLEGKQEQVYFLYNIFYAYLSASYTSF